ncbi:MAG: coaE [Candidatus Midichloriaceae bacterium]|jgi:dephospho-CoA kinase|nr:coaE [Candidatus Midichloriaceae bacterium]
MGLKMSEKKILLDPNTGQLIAITGGIGSGKSFVLQYLKELGFVVFDADKAVHEMLASGGNAYEEVKRKFPNAVIDNEINRKALGEIVFKDNEKLSELEEIIHPKVKEARDACIKQNAGKSVVCEIPLLFEKNQQDNYDLIIVTVAPIYKQRERALQRKDMTEDKFNAIIAKQVPDVIRLRGADFVIETGVSEQETKKQIREIIADGRNKRNSARH